MSQLKVDLHKRDTKNYEGYITVPNNFHLKASILPVWFFVVLAILIFTIGAMLGMILAQAIAS